MIKGTFIPIFDANYFAGDRFAGQPGKAQREFFGSGGNAERDNDAATEAWRWMFGSASFDWYRRQQSATPKEDPGPRDVWGTNPKDWHGQRSDDWEFDNRLGFDRITIDQREYFLRPRRAVIEVEYRDLICEERRLS